MSHVGKRPRENRARRAEGAEEEGLSASFTTELYHHCCLSGP